MRTLSKDSQVERLIFWDILGEQSKDNMGGVQWGFEKEWRKEQ